MALFKRKETSESSAFLAQTASSSSSLDPDLVGFREVSISQFFTWKTPRSETEEETPIQEVSASDLIVAVRGIILKPQFGFVLLDQDEQGKWSVVCKTKEAYFRGLREHIHYAHELPFAIPEFQPFASKKEVRDLHTFSISSPNTVPIGSRGESCAQCVAAGHHIVGTPNLQDGQADIKACSFTGNVLFVVFEVGRLVKRTMTNSRGKPVDTEILQWEDVTRATRRTVDVDGNDIEVPAFVERPFVLRLKMSRSTCFLNPAFVLNTSSFPFVPDKPESLARYLNSLSRSGDIFEISSEDPFLDGRVVYAAPTEIYFVSTTPETVNAAGLKPTRGYAPVFVRAQVPDPEAWLEAAWETYRLERSFTSSGIEGEPRPKPVAEIPVLPEVTPRPLQPQQALRSADPPPEMALPPATSKADKVRSMLDNLPRG